MKKEKNGGDCMINEFNPLVKLVDEYGTEVEFEIINPVIENDIVEKYKEDLEEIEEYISVVEKKAQELNRKSDMLTNHADKLDYAVATGCGVLTGILDAYFVGKLDLAKCHEWGSKKVNNFVKIVAGEKGDDADALRRAIEKLEKKSKSYFPSDSSLNAFGGGLQHHLRDFAHHPTVAGLLFSVLTQFTGKCYGTDTKGVFIVVPVEDKSRIGKTVQEKLLFGTVYWFLHLVSDMAGTGGTAGKGTGIPGPILALAKELSVIPPFSCIKFKDGDRDVAFSEFLSKIFNGTLFAEKDESGKIIKNSIVNVDLRTELGIIKTQMWPVLVNEILVRSFYSIRQLKKELEKNPVQEFKDLKKLDWRRIAPVKNGTLTRMLTISTGTFMAVDLGDAAVKAFMDAKKTTAAGQPIITSLAFAGSFLLRINFVGIGRFTMAVVSDVGMGMKVEKVDRERIVVYNQLLATYHAKVAYKQLIMLEENGRMLEKEGEMWVTAKDATEAIYECNKTMLWSMKYAEEAWIDIMQNTARMTEYIPKIEDRNPGLMEELFARKSDILRR